MRPERISAARARRIALGAQGFTDPPPTGLPDRRHLRRVLARTRLFQIDSVNVFERAHYLPLYSRLGPYDKVLLDEACRRPRRELFEYWGHEASLLPLALHPLLRWRMARAASGEDGWGSVRRIGVEHPRYVERVLAELTARGPASAGELGEQGRGASSGGWWGWAGAVPTGTGLGGAVKVALEHLFWAGRVTTAYRRGFERVYDLTERVLPAAVLDTPTPERPDAQRELVRLAAQSLGVATEGDLRDYFRLGVAEGRLAVADLVEAGDLLPVQVDGWNRPAYLWPGAIAPRRVPASALLSPFDPLVWERPRAARLFGFDYRIEIYVPAAQRVHGYYVLPFLHEGHLAARVDLKAERSTGRLRVAATWREGADDGCAAALAAELRRAASWQGLTDVVVDDRGDLAPALRAELRQA